ncbi:MAG: hypothetical protein J5590_04985 [Clostridia bacterium]|nr:hypothetical protein [Clostridia bacterium]
MKKLLFMVIALSLVFVSDCVAVKGDASLSLVYSMSGADGAHYIPEAYYASPIIVDFDSDGRREIVFGNYSLCVADAGTGNVYWKVNGGYDRTVPYKTGADVGILWDLDVCDIDGDGVYEIISVYKGGIVSVLDWHGYSKRGWPQQLAGEHGVVDASARSLEVADLNHDGKYEIIVGASTESAECVWVYDCRGNILEGWPQLASYQDAEKAGTDKIYTGFSFGVFMDGVTSGDIDGDGTDEVLVATDTGFLCIYNIKGKLMPANSKIFGGRTWGRVGLFESMDTEQDMSKAANEGWGGAVKGNETRDILYKGELGHSVVRAVDLNGDGKDEVITSAIILDRAKNTNRKSGDYDSSKYMTFFIFNGDRTRYGGWETVPTDQDFMGAPLIQDADGLAMGVQSEPVICDLNGDGISEILLNTYDGCVHAFSVNDALHEFGKFPYRIPQTGYIAETASGVVCCDLNGDGCKEVIFATATKSPDGSKNFGQKGGVYVLNYDGTLVAYSQLPDAYTIFETGRPAYTNFAYAKPAVGDVDNDGKYEIAVNTRYSGLCLYRFDGSFTTPKLSSNNVDDDITVKVSGNTVKFDQEPIIYNNRTMVPMRKIFESIGATVAWDPATKTATGIRGDRIVKITIGSKHMYLNNKLIEIDTPAMLVGDRTLVPVRAISEGLGCNVQWNDASRTVSIEPKIFQWSSWSTTRPNVDRDLFYVEEKTEYRYRTREKETYTQDTKTNSWNFIKEEVTYGSWSSWQRDRISENENREVKTRQQSEKKYYHYAHYCTGNISDANHRYRTSDYKFHSDCLYHDLGWFDYKLPEHPDGEGGCVLEKDDGKYYRCANTCYRWYLVETRGGDYLEYSSRPIYHKYYYWRWSDWSRWSDWQESYPYGAYYGNEYYDVESRTVYRYKEK